MSRKPTRPERKGLSRNQRQQLEKKLAVLEKEIHAKETQKALCEKKLASPPSDPAKLQKLSDEYQSLVDELDPLFRQWEELAVLLHEDEEQN